MKHIDVHLRVGRCLFNIATAIDIVDAGSRLDIHGDGTSFGFIRIAILVSTGIFGTVTTTHQILDDNRSITGLCLFYVDGNIAADTATLVIAAIDILEVAAGDG